MQLPLPVTLPVDENFDSFVNTGNEEVVSVLEQIADALPHWREAPELGPLASSAAFAYFTRQYRYR